MSKKRKASLEELQTASKKRNGAKLFIDDGLEELTKRAVDVFNATTRKKAKAESKKEKVKHEPFIIARKYVRTFDFERPPAVYSNTSPYGIAQEMLWEQAKDDLKKK